MHLSLQREIFSRYLDDRFGDKTRGLALKCVLEKDGYRENKVMDWMGLFREKAVNETRKN